MVAAISIITTIAGVGVTYGTMSGDLGRAKADVALVQAILKEHIHETDVRRTENVKSNAERDAAIRALQTSDTDKSRLNANVNTALFKLDALCRATPKANCGP
jgi:hypothetical protein